MAVKARMFSALSFSLRAPLLLGIGLGLTSCSAAEPEYALAVAGVGYSEVELGLLGTEERERLATLTAFGVIVANDELSTLAEPYVERREEALILQRLKTEISLRESGYDEGRLEELYDTDPEYELVVRHLVILSEDWRREEHREEARARAVVALREIEDGADFGEVAGEYSEEPGADRRGGLLEPGRRGTWVAEFWEAASALEVGGVSGVVESPYGYHVLKLEDRRPLPYEEVRYQVLDRLVDLDRLRPSAEAWARSESSAMEFDADAAIAWRDRDADDDVILARWPGGTYLGRDLGRHLRTLNDEALTRIESASREEFLAITRALAGNLLLTGLASELGIAVDDGERAELVEAELTRLRSLSGALSFRRNASEAEIKGAAMQALSASGQRARLARTELFELAPTIRYLYPLRSNSDAVKSAIMA